MEINLVRNGVFLQRHGHHVVLGNFTTLANGFGHLSRLPETKPYTATFVADDNQGTETKPPAAFDDFSRAVDEDDFFCKVTPAFAITRGTGIPGARTARTTTARSGTTSTTTTTTTV